MNFIKLRQIVIAVWLGTVASGALLSLMGQQAALGAPLRQEPVLSISKQSANNWTKRVKLVFSNPVSETLADFPVLVLLNSDRISYTMVQDAGQDLRFVDRYGRLLPHEIERWDEGGTSYVWVKASSISTVPGEDYMWLYYGNPDAADSQDATAVWSADYRAVWHFTDNLSDSTAVNDVQDANVTARTGFIAGGQDFDGVTDYVDAGSDSSIDNLFDTGGTVLAWINPRTFGGNGYGRIVDKSDSIFADGGWAFQMFERSGALSQTVNTVRFERGFTGERATWYAEQDSIITNTWQLLAVTYDDTLPTQTPAIYVNGVTKVVLSELSPTEIPASDADRPLFVGNFSEYYQSGSDRSFDGGLDEVRLVAAPRSAAWILAQYRTMTDDFITYLPPEPTVTPLGAIIGGPLTYTLTVSNSGGGIAEKVVVTDTLPLSASYVTGGQLVGGKTVSWTIPTIAAEDFESITFVVTSCAMSLLNNDYRVITSANQVASSVGPPLPTLLTPPTLNPNFGFEPPSITMGDSFTFTGLSQSDGAPFKAWQWAFGDGGVTVTQGITVSHSYPNPGAYTVTLTITDMCDYSATVSQTVNVYAPVLTITKYVTPQKVLAGERLTYTVIISNGGLGIASGVALSDTLPQSVTLTADTVTVTPSSVGGTVGPPPYLVRDLTITGGALVTVSYVVTTSAQLPEGAVLTNTVAVSSAQTPLPVQTVVTATTLNLPDLRVAKQSSHPAPLLPGQVITYSIVISNLGDGIATGVVVSDTLSPYTQLVSNSLRLSPPSAGDIVGVLPRLADNITIGGGQQVTVSLAVTVGLPPGPKWVITNTAAVSGEQLSQLVTGSVTDTITGYDLRVNKQSQPVQAVPGTVITYTVVVSNQTGSGVAGVIISDNIPTQVLSPTWRCSGIDCNLTSGSGNLSDTVDLPLSASVTWVITGGLPSSATGDVVNRVTVLAPDNLELTPGDNVATDTNTLLPTVNLAIRKDSTPEPVVPGQRLTYTVVASNTGPSDVAGVAISDTLPVELLSPEWVCFSLGTSCPAATGSGDIYQLVSLPANSSVAYVISAVVRADVTGQIRNTATLTVPVGVVDSNPDDNIAVDTANPQPEADLSVSLQAGPDPVASGSTLTYTLNITNHGPSAARGITVTHTLPGPTVYRGEIASGWNCSEQNNVLTCTRSMLSPGLAPTIVVTVTTPVTGQQLSSQAAVAAVTSDMLTGNNRATITTTVIAQFDLTLQKIGTPQMVLPGQPLTYSLIFTNLGPSAAVGVVLSDDIPAALEELTFVSESANITVTEGKTYSWQVAPLPPGAAGRITVTGLISTEFAVIPTVFTNTAEITAQRTLINRETGPAANIASAATVVTLPVISFYTPAYTVAESTAAAIITVSITPAPYATATVLYAATSGSAIADVDFGSTSGALTFAPGQTEVTFTVSISNDDLDEPDETVNLALSGGQNAVIGGDSAVLTIEDSDPPPGIGFSGTPYSVTESVGSGQITVTLDAPSGLPITVTYTITDGSATVATGDYIAGNGLLRFEPGVQLQTITVTISDDNWDEIDETIRVRLTDAVNATGTPLETEITVIDDDVVNLSVAKFGDLSIVPGERFTYTIVISNSGNAPATAVTIVDPLLSPYLTYIAGSSRLSPSGSGTVSSPPTLTDNAVISGGAQLTATFAVTVSLPLTDGLRITNTATVTSLQTTAPRSATVTSTIVATPSLHIGKTGPANAAVGQQVQYTFTVTNTGYSRLQNVVVVDNIAGVATIAAGDDGLDGWFDPGEAWIFTATYTVAPTAAAILTNTAVVTANDTVGTVVGGQATHQTVISFRPVLSLTKSGPLTTTVGQAAVYQFAIDHAPASDRSPVTEVTVDDDIAGAASLVSRTGNGDNWLDWGEVWTYTAAKLIGATTPNPLTNTGRVAAEDRAGNVVTATANHRTNLTGFDPQLFVDVDGPTQARLLQRVNFTYTVINVNILSLFMLDLPEIGVADIGDGSPIDLTSVIGNGPGNPATYVDGDYNLNGMLDGTEAWVYTAGYTITLADKDPLSYTAVVLGLDPEGDVVSATETVQLDILHEPELQVAITAPITAAVNEVISLTLTMRHSELSDDSALSITAVNDNVLGQANRDDAGDIDGDNLLGSGEVWTYTISYTVKASDPTQLRHTTTIQGLDLDRDKYAVQLGGTIQLDKLAGPAIYHYLPIVIKKLE
jgi:uncharacterized repeat protein (TIGR01451 family)